MATATGSWEAYLDSTIHFSDPPHQRDSLRSKKPTPQRKHHYTFDVDDNGLDINGFILQTDKHKGKRQKFRVYLDSNENGRFDKNDRLIGRTGLKKKHAVKGVGNLLDEDEIGQIEVTFKKPKSNGSMSDAEDVDDLSQSIGVGGGRVSSMSFGDGDANKIATTQSLVDIDGNSDDKLSMDGLNLNKNIFAPLDIVFI